MSILQQSVRPRFRVIRPRRPFAEGLIPEPAPADRLPAGVNRVRLLSGAAAGAYRGVVGPTGFREWHREDDGVVVLGLHMDRAYTAGRVAILSDGPLAPFPAPKPSDPRALDDVWNSGWRLGRMGLDAAPCRDWADDLKASFRDGLGWGRQQLDAAREADNLDELARDQDERDGLSSEWWMIRGPHRAAMVD